MKPGNRTPDSHSTANRTVTRLAVLLFAALVLAGCGGGDSPAAPVAQNGTLSTAEDTPASGVLVATDADSSTLTYSIVRLPTKGMATINASTGAYTYTPILNANGDDDFTFKANDGSSDSNTATITVTINAVNDPPTPTADSFTVAEGSTTTLDLAANDSDIDNALDLTSITIISGPGNGSLVVNANGTVDYTHNGSETSADSFTYTIDDQSGATSNTATVNLTITPVNDAPIAMTDSFTVDEGSTTTLNLAANDSDADDGLNLTTIAVTGPGNGSLVVNANGTVDYTHNGSEAPLADSFTYTIDDQSGATSNTATVNLTITPANDAPIAVADSYTVGEGSTMTLNLAANDSDIDNALDLTSIAIISGPGNGSIVVNANGTVDYTHDGSETPLTDSFTYTIDDQSGATSNTVTVNLTITPVNDAPDAVADNFTVDEGSTTMLDLAANDSDPDDGLDLTSIAVSIPGNGSLIVNTDGTVDYTHDGSETTSDSFTYTINDQSGTTSNTATVNLTITPVNDPPAAAGSCGTTAQAMTLIAPLGASDPDTADTLTYSLNADGSGGAGPIITSKGSTVTLNTSTGEYTYLPATGAGDYRGRDSFEYQVTDSGSLTDNAIETVIVDQKIMPLGDSITTGETWIGPPDSAYLTDLNPAGDLVIGYRKSLFDSLTGAGYTFDFVGSRNHGGNYFSDTEHEGHDGWTAVEIAYGGDGSDSNHDPAGKVQAWLDSNPADIILLHAGSNDLLLTDKFDIENILNEIDTWAVNNSNPVTVLLALIIDQYDNGTGSTEPYVTTFNTEVQAMVAGRTWVNTTVNIVDQHSALLYPDDLSETTGIARHPNAGGYTKMAGAWSTALEAVVDKCP